MFKENSKQLYILNVNFYKILTKLYKVCSVAEHTFVPGSLLILQNVIDPHRNVSLICQFKAFYYKARMKQTSLKYHVFLLILHIFLLCYFNI